MRILVNDHSGHAFPISLSQALATRKYKVAHTYSANFQSPKGNFFIQEELKPYLEIKPIYYASEFNKYSLYKRRNQELEYAEKLITEIQHFQPEIVICGNTPLFAQEKIQNYCLRHKIKFVLWCQDVYSVAITGILNKKLGFVGSIVGSYFQVLEKKQLRRSDHIVNITSDFSDLFNTWKIPTSKMTVIPNWAPINQVPLYAKENEWSLKNKLSKSFNFIYSGTLGLKHNPVLLSRLALAFKGNKDVKIVVISEGIGADYLKEEKEKETLDNLVLLPFQDFSDLPMVLGTSDILVAILEPDAGVYSVPSKVLTYMCAGKPILLSVPKSNLSSKIIFDNDAGVCSDPNKVESFIESAKSLYLNHASLHQKGKNARAYAEYNFNLDHICERFITVIKHVAN